MTKKSTKSALLTSSISLFICFAMLVGTTFAWFTDSVTSANNIIKSGNLDVEFEYWNGSGWTSVAAASDILTNELWEPGVTEVAYLKVSNAGSLALKYQLGVNIVNETEGTNVAGDTFKLSDYIQFGVVENVNGETGAYADRADAVAAVSNADIISAGYTTESTIEAGAADQYFALVVWMPTTVGNEANHNGTAVPKIELGINVFATQLTSEDDSFGDQYDASAELPTIVVHSAEALQDAIDNAKNGEVITLADDITGDLSLEQNANVKVIINGDGNTFDGVLTLNGKSKQYDTAGIVIKNMNFKAASLPAGADACIRLGNGTSGTRYVCNATIENCTFDVPGAVGIKSYTGGDKNVQIINCTASESLHSLAQLKGVDGVVVKDCTIKSIRGINFNNSNNIRILTSTIDVQKYAVRFGSDVNNTSETYAISNCTLSSQNVEGDPTIEFRAGAMTNSTLTLTNTTISGNPQMTGADDVNIIYQ